MARMNSICRMGPVLAALLGLALPVGAQTPAAPPPASPAPSVPAPAAPAPAPDLPIVPTPATPGTPAPLTPVPPPSAAPATPPVPAPPVTSLPAGQPSFAAFPSLVPPSTNAADVDEVTLSPKPAAIIAGKATWDEGFNALRNAFTRGVEAAASAGLKPAGKPLARFLETDDEGFTFEALVPLDGKVEGKSELASDVKLGTTPAGKALRFVHKAPYDEIDSTYEAITAYLDAKGIVVEDSFVEEYLTDLTNGADPALEINILVMPK